MNMHRSVICGFSLSIDANQPIGQRLILKIKSQVRANILDIAAMDKLQASGSHELDDNVFYRKLIHSEL